MLPPRFFSATVRAAGGARQVTATHRRSAACFPVMSVRMQDVISGVLGELRYEPTTKRIRARLGGETVVDSNPAVLLWEPRRVVATWAVPAADVRAELAAGAPAPPAADDVGHPLPHVHA